MNAEDEIVGVSVSIRDRDDIIQVWNQDAKYSEQARVIEAIYDLDQELTLHNSFYKAHCDHSAFESGSKRPGQQQGGPRKYEGFSHTPPSYGSSPRQSFGGTRDFAPQRYGSSPRQVFGGARDAAREPVAKKISTIGITFNLKLNTLCLTYKYSDYKSVFDMFLLIHAPLSLPWRQMFTALVTKRPAIVDDRRQLPFFARWRLCTMAQEE
eukprot:gene2344-17981_t